MSLATIKWIALGILAAGLLFFANLAMDRGADLKVRTAERDAATLRAIEWKDAADKAADLAQATAEARTAENKTLLDIARAVGSTKQGIANAPGSDAPFTYSDSAYRFMRARPEAPAGGPAKAPAGVDGR